MDGPPTLVASHLADVSPLADILTEKSLSPQLLAASTSKGYLSHLATLPLTELVQEPVSLQTQSHHLTSSLTSFTHTSYPTFISLHKTTTALASSIESLSSSLNDLLETSLPSLEESTGAWKSRTEAVLRERNKARVVLEQHEKIRDLLDIPILIDTCVRNGYFGEALSLASHVTTLANRPDDKHKDRPPPPVILTSVLSEVQHSIMQMHSSLLSTLYDPSRKLPALWKAVNFLRKMDAFGSNPSLLRLGSLPHLKPIRSSSQDSPTRGRCPEPSSEEQLALAFLIGRESCLKTILETSRRDIQRLAKEEKELDEREKEDLARYLKKYIDSWREGVYDIITQYATIFLERSSTHPETPTNTDDEDFSRLHTLLRTYATRALSTHLFSIIRPSLPLLALSRLPSLLTQLTYCSTAFARLGLDFQFTLTAGGGLFSTAILSIIKRDFDSASEKWIQRIRKARGSTVKPGSRMSAYSPRPAAGPAELPSKWLVLPSLATSPPVPPSSTKRGSGSNGPPHIPPQILASYPPLAELTNAVLGVLNGLRLLVPRHPGTGVYELLRMLDEIILTHGSSALVEYLNLVMASLKDEDEEKVKVKEREERVVGAAGRVFFDVFVVFVRRALVEGVYGLELDGVGAKGKGGEDLGWVGKREEFERLVIDLGGDESEEDEEDEDEDEDEDGDGDGEE
ncbi:hypothetical protein P691DRAFT_740209 [Macrolepiota fuliginosa MF-IS2]|uniref:Conserved oligomeric Golgi complex subunit 8 n=1 Tax=Macrolepiota fuliginosa MF-IS2 TaxID=1400762 RepID=A0A9P6BWB2_9AGAR|nr:hypothetical protein P691DRAFT_740209 [Macrolepiota fuliginosa MF-IS2]